VFLLMYLRFLDVNARVKNLIFMTFWF